MSCLITEYYQAQAAQWPNEGRVILAQYDEESVLVYQAYRPEIGLYAAEHGHFGGAFSFSRMSWLKTNFLWMMYRSGWGTKLGQEVTLAIRLHRSAFDEILARAVPSTYSSEHFSSSEDWKRAVSDSEVRLQWDPDHGPRGDKLERRAIQLGLRGNTLAAYANEWIVDIEDISEFVNRQRIHVESGDYARLLTPKESAYPVDDSDVAHRIGLNL